MRIRLPLFRPVLFALSFFSLLLLSFLAQAQEAPGSVTGVVHDVDNKPVVGVTVVARNTKTNFSAGTNTDTTGVFTFNRLPAGGPYSFAVSAVGYIKKPSHV